MVQTPVRPLSELVEEEFTAAADPEQPQRSRHARRKALRPGDMRPGSDYMPPLDSRFEDKENGIDLPFLDAPGLEQIAQVLIEQCPELQHLEKRVVRGFWKRNGGKKNRKLHLGECKQPSGIDINLMPGVDYWFWLAADHHRDNGMTREQIEESLYHELCHTADSDDDDPKPVRVGHDYEGFASQIRRYGVTQDGLRSIVREIRQLPLFEAGETN